MQHQPLISVIIPTLNEEKNLRRLLPELLALSPVPEIVISDGGSNDTTLSVANTFKVKVSKLARGRGPQLNEGIKLATGKVMLFLHADSTLPPESYSGLIKTLVARPDLDGGAFRFSLLHTQGIWPRIYELNVMLRCKVLNLPYGDQGFFIRRTGWEESLRFADIPLMEDVEWWERVSLQLTLSILPYPLITSARRFSQRGYLYSAIRNIWMLTRYKFGVSPFKLVKEYSR